MPMPKITQKQLYTGAGLLVVVLLVVFLARYFSKPKTEERNIDVKVRIPTSSSTGTATTEIYDPTPLLRRLNKGLTTRYYFDFSDRCNPIKELHSLDAVKFMATINAYKVKYNEDIETHMRACYVDCNTGTGGGANYFDLIYQRRAALRDIIN